VSETRKVLLIANPLAGRGRLRARELRVALFRRLLEESGVSCEVAFTAAPGDATRP
jgi:diacylglycerol kinase family enzyme